MTITLASLNRFLQFLYHFNREEILHTTVVKFITLIVCAPYFVNLNNNTFQLKMLLFLVHLHSQQKRSEIHLQLSNLQCCHFDIVILRVAIISNVQNVSTCRRRGSHQTGSVRTTR